MLFTHVTHIAHIAHGRKFSFLDFYLQPTPTQTLHLLSPGWHLHLQKEAMDHLPAPIKNKSIAEIVSTISTSVFRISTINLNIGSGIVILGGMFVSCANIGGTLAYRAKTKVSSERVNPAYLVKTPDNRARPPTNSIPAMI